MDPRNRHRNTRRDFLAFVTKLGTASAFAGEPLALLLRAAALGAAERAVAQATGTSVTNYIRVALDGAPPRWADFLFLNPYEPDSKVVTNPQFGTGYTATNGVATGLAYATASVQTANGALNVPPLWLQSVPKAGGGLRPMTDLLQSMLSIRGVNADNPAHAGAQQNNYAPIGTVESMPALAADYSPAYIPALNMSAQNYLFRSKLGKSSVFLPDGGNMLTTLLSPFQSNASATFKAGQATLAPAIGAAIGAITADATVLNKEVAVAETARASAESLMNKSFGDLNATWTGLLGKYTDLVQRAIDTTVPLPGLTDAPIGISGSRSGAYNLNGVLITDADLRTTISAAPASARQTTVASMAMYFAVTEYAITTGLTSSIAISPRTFSGMVLNGKAGGSGFFDEHETGGMVSLLHNAMYGRAMAACLIELIDQLTAAGLFNNTVIQFNSEFCRAPRQDGAGSDHGYTGTNPIFFNGKIKGPIVIGNIMQNAPDTTHPGTWGYGGTVETLGTSLNLAYISATMAKLMGLPSPTTAVASLVDFDANGNVKPLIEPAKMV